MQTGTSDGGVLYVIPFLFHTISNHMSYTFQIFRVTYYISYKNYKFRFQYVIPFLRCSSKIVETLGIIANAKLLAVSEFS